MNQSFKIFSYATWTVLIAVATMACGSASEKNSDVDSGKDPAITALRNLEKDVIDVHDEVMPKMATLNNTRVKLLKHYGDKNLSADKRTGLSNAIMHLEEADSLMWAWMHNYNRPDYDRNLDSARIYLENEMATVTIMRDKFLSSMEEGEALLIKYAGDDN